MAIMIGRQVDYPRIRPFSGDNTVAQGKYLFTSESVSMGHPDKLCRPDFDGVLDALFAKEPLQPRCLRGQW